MKKRAYLSILCLILIGALIPTVCAAEQTAGHKHKFGERFDVVKATCLEAGSYKVTCKTCGETFTKTLKKKDHKWSDCGYIEEPTCTEEGGMRQECEVCGSERVKMIKALDHDYTWKTVKKATCSSGGEQKGICKRCGKEKTRKTSPAEHLFEDRTVILEATPFAQGIASCVCSVCGYEEEVPFDPEGTLRVGSEDHEAVKVLQQALLDLGLLEDKVDGIFGKKTEKAVKKYQLSSGMEDDGVAWPGVIDEILSDQRILLYGVSACCPVEDMDGNPTWQYCEEHAGLLEALADLIIYGGSDQRVVLQDLINAGNYELGLLFDRPELNRDPNTFALLSARRAALSAQMAAWKQGEVTEETVYACEDACMDLIASVCSAIGEQNQ